MAALDREVLEEGVTCGWCGAQHGLTEDHWCEEGERGSQELGSLAALLAEGGLEAHGLTQEARGGVPGDTGLSGPGGYRQGLWLRRRRQQNWLSHQHQQLRRLRQGLWVRRRLTCECVCPRRTSSCFA